MNFSYAKLTTLHPEKEKRLFTFFLAMITAAAIFLPSMLISQGYFTFYGDFNVQQITFYKNCHQAIRTGNTAWSWITDLGSNFVGSYTFYLLGSPFFWLTIPFPNNFVPYLMGPLLILKFGCAALTAYLYIRRFTKTPQAACLGGLLYAFSGFSVYNIFFNHFHESIIIFPLLLLSLELLIVENKRGFFALMVAASAIINYYFFFGMVVFTVIYYFVRLFSGAFEFRFLRFLVVAFEAVLGVALAAAILMPSFEAVIGNERVSQILLGWDAITYKREQIYFNIIECFFFPPDLPARPVFFPDAEVRWSSLGGWLPVFSMAGVFTWFFNRKNNWLKHLIGICIFIALVPILNSMFSALNHSYYARWFYMPILMMILATVMLTEDSSVDWKRGFRWTAGITVGIALVIGLFPQKNDKGDIAIGLFSNTYFSDEYSTVTLFGRKINLPFDLTYFLRFWITVLIAVVGIVMLWLLLKCLPKNRKRFYRGAIACVCIVSVIYANLFIIGGRRHSFGVDSVVIDQLIEGEAYIEDESEFRIDVYEGADNTGMFLGYPCINAFHSVVPSSITEFYDYLGKDRTVASRPGEDLAAIRPLLSVKYMLDSTLFKEKFAEDGKTVLPAYKYVKTTGGYDLYENLNYIPYGFSYEYYMTRDFCDSYTEENRANMMLKAILLDDEQIKRYSGILKNIEDSNDASFSISDSEMAKDCRKLKATSAYEFKIDNKGFTAKVERDKASLVFFSVPYDKGWSATVNGEPAQIEKVNVGFMAVEVDKGDSVIRFDYETPSLALGCNITEIALAFFVGYLIIVHYFKKHHYQSTFYPEGEELLSQWQAEDIVEAASDQTALEFSDDALDEDSSGFIDVLKNQIGFVVDSEVFWDDKE